MLTGMMHGIGKLYVLTRAIDHPELFASAATLKEIISQWHASIGKAILENWNFSESMAQAVGEQDDFSRNEEGPPDLSDVIAIAILMATYVSDTPGLEAALNGLAAARRLGLDEAQRLGGDARFRRRSDRAQPGSRQLTETHSRRSQSAT